MAHGQCLRCKYYGLIERHHPLPRRWFGNNSWVEVLCFKCHRWADNITLDIDADYRITSERDARRHKDLYIKAFCCFMNTLEGG